MKVLFSHSYFYRFDPKQWENSQPYPPLGTLTAAAYLRENGFETDFFDSNLVHSPKEIKPHLNKNPDFFVLYDDGFNYLTKMCLTNMREAAFEMIAMAKSLQIPVAVCSSDATDHCSEYLKAGADYIIIGEGEQTLLELVQNEKDIQDIKGLAFLQDEGVFYTPPRPVVKNLDIFPMAAWDLVDMKSYQNIWLGHHGYFSLNIATTRGCPFKCNWCAKPIYGNRYNSRSPQKVADEIAFLIEKFQVEHFWMCDDIFGLKPGWVETFADEVEMRHLDFKFKIQSRADLLLQKSAIDHLVRAGLDEVWIGAESGSQKILDAMDKGITVEQIHMACEQLKAKDVKVGFFLQFGYLNESAKDIQKTLRLVKKALPHALGISVSYPLPGTVFHEKVSASMSIKTNWRHSDDLDPMYPSTFNTTYYKQLHRFVHKRFQSLKAGEEMTKIIREPSNLNFQQMLKGFLCLPLAGWYWMRMKIAEKPLVR